MEGLTREEQDWLDQQTNAERAKMGLPPLPASLREELVMIVSSISSALRSLFRRIA